MSYKVLVSFHIICIYKDPNGLGGIFLYSFTKSWLEKMTINPAINLNQNVKLISVGVLDV